MLHIYIPQKYTRDKQQKRKRLEKKRQNQLSLLFLLRLLQVSMFRSKSCREEIRNRSITNKYHCFTNERKSEAETPPSPTTNRQPPVMLRSYSTSTYSPHKNPTTVRVRDNNKMKKGLKGMCEAEIQRKKRVAAYNVYGVEGKVKGSMKKSFKWFKDTCLNAVYGFW